MPAPLAASVNTHTFPRFFHRFPRTLRLVHFITGALTLRVWYVRRTIRAVLRSTPQPFTYLDAGCGGGDFLFSYVRRYRSSTFIGVDRSEGNLSMCSRYAEKAGLANLALRQASLESLDPNQEADVVACISVLQYTEDDAAVLERLHGVLNDGGRLILYVPVNGRSFFPFYPRLARRLGVHDYEERQSRRRLYTTEDIVNKMAGAGFTIESQVHAYGPTGVAYHEMYSLLLATLLHGPRLLAPFVAAGLVVLYPFLFVLMLADYAVPNRTGNGLLMVARKSPLT